MLPSQCKTCFSLAPFLKLICARLKIREKGEAVSTNNEVEGLYQPKMKGRGRGTVSPHG